MPTARWETTSTALLDALHDPGDDGAWREFDARYRPVLVGVGLRLGLQPADATDAAQETLYQFVREYRAGAYHRGKGRLGAWLAAICRHRVIDLQRARGRRPERDGPSAVVRAPDLATVTRCWDEALRQRIIDQALRVLREDSDTSERTLEVFERAALREVPPAAIAADFDMQVAEVYRIKHRVTKRLRHIVEQLTSAYSEG